MHCLLYWNTSQTFPKCIFNLRVLWRHRIRHSVLWRHKSCLTKCPWMYNYKAYFFNSILIKWTHFLPYNWCQYIAIIIFLTIRYILTQSFIYITLYSLIHHPCIARFSRALQDPAMHAWILQWTISHVIILISREVNGWILFWHGSRIVQPFRNRPSRT